MGQKEQVWGSGWGGVGDGPATVAECGCWRGGKGSLGAGRGANGSWRWR